MSFESRPKPKSAPYRLKLKKQFTIEQQTQADTAAELLIQALAAAKASADKLEAAKQILLAIKPKTK